LEGRSITLFLVRKNIMNRGRLNRETNKIDLNIEPRQFGGLLKFFDIWAITS
jgi:hypothetical protein